MVEQTVAAFTTHKIPHVTTQLGGSERTVALY